MNTRITPRHKFDKVKTIDSAEIDENMKMTVCQRSKAHVQEVYDAPPPSITSQYKPKAFRQESYFDASSTSSYLYEVKSVAVVKNSAADNSFPTFPEQSNLYHPRFCREETGQSKIKKSFIREKVFRCREPECNKSFSMAFDLVRHEQLHEKNASTAKHFKPHVRIP